MSIQKLEARQRLLFSRNLNTLTLACNGLLVAKIQKILRRPREFEGGGEEGEKDGDEKLLLEPPREFIRVVKN